MNKLKQRIVSMGALALAGGLLIGVGRAQAATSTATGAAEPGQYTSAGHVLGFETGGYRMSNGAYALNVRFEGAQDATPSGRGATDGAMEKGKATPLSQATYAEVWKGISVTYDAPRGGIARSTWTPQPGADPRAIQMRYNRKVNLRSTGELSIAFATGSMSESRPVAWQEVDGQRKFVDVQFALLGNDLVGFQLGDYRADLPLTIDPTLSWNTFLGGTVDGDYDSVTGVAVDANGNTYVAGISDSAGWGTPVRAYSGHEEAFVAKLDSAGNVLWNTFLGSASNDDEGMGIALSGSNLYVCGYSGATWGSPIAPKIDSGDVFVARLDASSGALLWNTFIGGSGSDFPWGIAADASGSAYVVGHSDSTWGSPVNPLSGPGDTFVARFTSSGTLSWNTFHAGGFPRAIAAADSGNVYVVGATLNSWGSPLRAYTGDRDAYVMKFNSNGTYAWHTFLGGSAYDSAEDVAVDASENIYVAGVGLDWGTPLTPNHGSADALVAKLTSAGSLVWHTFVGGTAYDDAEGIAIGAAGSIYLGGSSEGTWGSPIRPFTESDAYAVKLTAGGNVIWNTFLGGTEADYGYEIGVSASGAVVVAGDTEGDIEAAWGAPVRAFTGDDVFVALINDVPDAPVELHDSVILPVKPLTVKIGAGATSVSKSIKVKVQNADILPVAEAPGHTIQLVADDGTCPAGTVVGLPDFDKKTAGAQDSILIAGGKSAKALVALNIDASAFTTADLTRCKILLSVSSPGNSDPSLSNNTVPVELNVVDANRAEVTAVHQTSIKSLKPLKIGIGVGATSKLSAAKLAAANADGDEPAGHAITVTTNDDSCPVGTIGVADYDSETDGPQNAMTVAGGTSAGGVLPITASASEFTSTNKKSPHRCMVTVTTSGPSGDTDASNNAATLIIDVYDKNDL